MNMINSAQVVAAIKYSVNKDTFEVRLSLFRTHVPFYFFPSILYQLQKKLDGFPRNFASNINP